MMGMTSNVDKITGLLEKNARDALLAVGEFIKGEAQLRCPVRTGNLKNSITYVVDEPGKRTIIGTPVEYSIYVEKGTSKMRAQPYLTPALEENKQRIEKLVADIMGRGIS